MERKIEIDMETHHGFGGLRVSGCRVFRQQGAGFRSCKSF